LKAGKRENRSVTAGGHERGAVDPRAGGRGEPDGWAPPVNVRRKKKKGRGVVGSAEGRAGPLARGRGKRKAGGLAGFGLRKRKRKDGPVGPKKKKGEGRGVWGFSF
jgi:hypothetical protein